MKKIIVSMMIVFLLLAGNVFGEDKIRVAGAGGMITLATELAKMYMAENRNVVIEVNQKSIESTGGIMSAAGGQIEIGMSARPLKDDEKGLGLTVIEIARVATVIGVNKSVPLKAITSEQLCRIYAGVSTNWNDLNAGKDNIMPLSRPDRDATKESLRKSLVCFNELKESSSVVVVPTAPEMTKILVNRPGTIGFTDSVAIADSGGAIVGLAIDGVAPTSENVRTGKYRIIKDYFLLTKGEPKGAVKAFIEFVKSPKGARVIEANTAVPVK